MFANHHICVVLQSSVCYIDGWICQNSGINPNILKYEFYAIMKLRRVGGWAKEGFGSGPRLTSTLNMIFSVRYTKYKCIH
jgi:hypothetical protein